MIKRAYDTVKIEYSQVDKRLFKILFIGEADVVSSKTLTSLDAARIHHVLANIESNLRYEIKFTTDQLSGIAPLLIIEEAELTLYINRLEIHERQANTLDFNVFYYPFKHFDDIDQLKNYFAEAQY